MKLHEQYPGLFERLGDESLEMRHLLNVDENEEDFDSEEFEFDPDEYNYVVYIASPIQEILGKEKLLSLIEKMGNDKTVFADFFTSEIDLYGVKSDKEAEEIAHYILGCVEEMI